MIEKIYPVRFISASYNLGDSWENGIWQNLPHLEVNHFRPESSDHRPRTQVKIAYDTNGLLGKFKVKDRYVICRHTGFQAPVYKDTCVEFFLQPKISKGYFNFEFNCGGTLLASYITDPTRVPGGFKAYTPLSAEEGRKIIIHASQPPLILKETENTTTWQLAFFIPFELLEKYIGPLNMSVSVDFKANFFKCADECSHPHWAAWSPVDQLNFHLPGCFGTLQMLTE